MQILQEIGSFEASRFIENDFRTVLSSFYKHVEKGRDWNSGFELYDKIKRRANKIPTEILQLKSMDKKELEIRRLDQGFQFLNNLTDQIQNFPVFQNVDFCVKLLTERVKQDLQYYKVINSNKGTSENEVHRTIVLNVIVSQLKELAHLLDSPQKIQAALAQLDSYYNLKEPEYTIICVFSLFQKSALLIYGNKTNLETLGQRKYSPSKESFQSWMVEMEEKIKVNNLLKNSLHWFIGYSKHNR